MTSILTYCQLLQSPSKVAAGNELTNVGNQLRISQNESGYEFNKVFSETCKSDELYSVMVDDITKYFLGGYNACVLIAGDCENLERFLSGGINFFPVCVEEISRELCRRNKAKESRKSSMVSGRSSKRTPHKMEVTMGIYEICKEHIINLMTASESANEVVKVVEDSFDGNVIKDGHCLDITDSSSKEATRLIATAMNKSSLLSRKQETASVVLELSLKKDIEGFEVPVSTWLRFICVSSVTLQDQLNCVPITSVSRKSTATFQSKEVPIGRTSTMKDASILKKVLSDPMGGNCITKCLMLLQPVVVPTTNMLLSCLAHLQKVFNYPVDNTPHIKGLLRQYRNKVKYFEWEMYRERSKNEAYAEQLKEQIAELRESNKQLVAEKSELHETLTSLQNEQTVALRKELQEPKNLPIAEKLQMSKDAVELRLYANHLQQEAEKQLFEMNNKCLAEEDKSSTLDRNLAYERKLHKDLKVQFERLRSEQSELLEEYINLKTNYQSMCHKYHEQGEVNHDLNDAVTQLSDLKEKILVDKNESHIRGIKEFSEKLLKLKQNLQSISEVEKIAKNEPKVEKIAKNEPKISHMDSSHNDAIEQLHKLCEDEFQEFEQLIYQFKITFNEKDASIGVYKKKIAQLTTKMMLLQNEKNTTGTQLLELKDSLSKLSIEYKARLEQYLNDLNIYFSTTADGNFETEEFIQHVNKMLTEYENANKDMKKNDVKRDEEVKVSAELILKKHEQLLIAYRILLQKHTDKYDEGDVLSYEIMMPPDHEIQLESFKERNQLKTKLVLVEEQVRELEEKLERSGVKIRQLEVNGSAEQYDKNNPWNDVTRKVREFTMSVQHNLEKEKAQLLTRCHLAEQQLETYYDFMKETTRRYELEISHLKYLLNDSHYTKARPNFTYGNQLTIPHGEPGGFLPPIKQPYSNPYDQR